MEAGRGGKRRFIELGAVALDTALACVSAFRAGFPQAMPNNAITISRPARDKHMGNVRLAMCSC